MRALLETLAQTEDRILLALGSMVAAYFAWGMWAAARGASSGSAGSAPPDDGPSTTDPPPP